MITLSCFHTQDGQWSRKKSRKVIFIIGTITFNLQSHGHKNDKQFSPGPTPGREHQHTFNATSNSISSMIWIAPTAMARWSMQRHRKYQVSWPTLSSNKVNRCLARYSPRATITKWPTNRAPNKRAWTGPNWPKMPILGQLWLFLGKKSFFFTGEIKNLLTI